MAIKHRQNNTLDISGSHRLDSLENLTLKEIADLIVESRNPSGVVSRDTSKMVSLKGSPNNISFMVEEKGCDSVDTESLAGKDLTDEEF
jgi:hypothetical protein